MSNIDHGMNVGLVEALGQMLEIKATAIEDVIATLNAKLAELETGWVGPDASQFRGQWPSYQSQLTTIANSLRDYSTKAIKNARDQTTTSSGL